MVIKKATLQNIDELEALYNTLNDFLASTRNYPGWIKHIYPVRETAVQGIEEGSLFVAMENNIIVGSIILNHEPEEAYHPVKWLVDTDYENILVVRTLVVHPEYMKQQVGSNLMTFARKYALGNGIKSIRLDVSVNNKPAIELYRKMGYDYIATVDLGLPYKHLKWFELYELLL